MSRCKLDTFVLIAGAAAYAILFALGNLLGNTGFKDDCILFTFFIIFAYLAYEMLNLNTTIYAFFALSLVPHLLGIYGFYFKSPFSFIQWDHITHFFPMMACSIIFFRFLQQFMEKKFFRFNTLMLIGIALTAALGVGAFIEKSEYLGFIINGLGEGGFAFGAGDACAGQAVTTVEEIDKFGGGWLNTMADLIWNFYGAIAGIIMASFIHFYPRREDCGNY